MTDGDVRRMLDDYTRAVRELRAIALDARERIERARMTTAEAATFARRRRRRARKVAAIAARRGAAR